MGTTTHKFRRATFITLNSSIGKMNANILCDLIRARLGSRGRAEDDSQQR